MLGVQALKWCRPVCKVARAKKRGLDERVCTIALALHDIYAIETGRYTDHARLGVPIAEQLLQAVPELSSDQVALILRMIGEHSSKETFSSDPYVELAKDADVLDCFFYPDAEDFYLTVKPLEVCKHYFRRIAKIRKELGLPCYPRYESLDRFRPGWLQYRGKIDRAQLTRYVERLFPEVYDPTCQTPCLAAFLNQNCELHAFSVDPLEDNSLGASGDKCAGLSDQLPATRDWLLVCWPCFNAYELLDGLGEAPLHRIEALGGSPASATPCVARSLVMDYDR